VRASYHRILSCIRECDEILWDAGRSRRRQSTCPVTGGPVRYALRPPRHAVRATCRGPGPPEQGEAARRTRRANSPGPRAGRRHQLRTEQRTSADGLGGRARRRGVPRTP